MTPGHAPLLGRKLFAARAAVNAAFADLDDAPLSPTEHADAVATRNDLLARLDRSSLHTADPFPSNSERLDAYLARQARDHVGPSTAAAGGRGHREVVRRLAEISARYRSMDCGACAECVPASAPCHAEPQDDEIVTGCGDCIRELHGMFARIWTSTAAAYDDALGLAPGTITAGTSCVLSTRSPQTGPVTGSTAFHDDALRKTVVQISFPEDASSATLAALPYVLFHELASHALYCSATRPPRRQRGGYDEWSEAWMDCVAYALLRIALDEGRPIVAAAPAPFSPGEVEAATVAAHRARYAPGRFPAAGAGLLCEARARFRAMEARIRRCLGDDARRMLLKSMIVLNALGAPEDLVCRLSARSIAFRQGVASDADVLSRDESLVWSALVRFRDHQDALALERELTI